jgi:hypothetical protein
LSPDDFNPQCNVIVRYLGFLNVNEDFQSGKRNAFRSINGWNALRIISASIEPRALASQIGVFSPDQAVCRQM